MRYWLLRQIERNRAKNAAKRRKSHRKRLRKWRGDLEVVVRKDTKGRSVRTKEKFTLVNVPAEFSFLQNPGAALELVKELKTHCAHGRQVNINLHNIKALTNDAIALLLSVMSEFTRRKITVIGTYPKDQNVRSRLEQSGFFEYVMGQVESKNKNTKNTIFAANSKVVSSKLSSEIIESASMTVFGDTRTNEGLQRMLIECMTNTFDHANVKIEGHENWWLSVEHDDVQKKVSFAFIDNGAGILKSIKRTSDLKGLGLVIQQLLTGGNTNLLKRMLEGALKKGYKSRTGKPHRGKGIPGMYDAFQRNSFSNFEVLTNDVHAKLSTSTYEKLNIEFEGTFIYAEYNQNNVD